MADIVDPQAVKFVNEAVRPFCHQIRALKAESDSNLSRWASGINAIVGSDAGDTVVDGRAADGITQLTAAEVSQLVGYMQGVADLIDAGNVAANIERACARPLDAS